VLQVNAKKISGPFSSVSATAISLQVEGRQEMIRKEDVRRVKLMGNTHRMRNALIGGAEWAQRHTPLVDPRNPSASSLSGEEERLPLAQ
jgi:hypothetical protein